VGGFPSPKLLVAPLAVVIVNEPFLTRRSTVLKISLSMFGISKVGVERRDAPDPSLRL